MSNLQLYSDCKNIPDVYCGPFNEERYYIDLFRRHARKGLGVTAARIGYETHLEWAREDGLSMFYVMHHGKKILRADFTGGPGVARWTLWSGGSRTSNGRTVSSTTLERLRSLSPARLYSHKGTLWCETQDTTDGLYQRGYPTWGDGPAELHPKREPGRRYVEFVDGLVVNAAGYAIGADR